MAAHGDGLMVTVMTERHSSLPGRRAVVDARDLWYLLGDRSPELTQGMIQTAQGRVIRGAMVYDQEDQPQAVACALLAALHASPQKRGPSRCPPVTVLDRMIRETEGALGPSVTLRSGCKVLTNLGLILGYVWSFEAAEIARYLATGHGLVLGLDWYEAMNRPDATGLVRAWGRPIGGHAVFAWGYDLKSDCVLFQNSRGPSWGGWSTRRGRHDFKGCARLPLSDLEKLLADNGEAVALLKKPYRREA